MASLRRFPGFNGLHKVATCKQERQCQTRMTLHIPRPFCAVASYLWVSAAEVYDIPILAGSEGADM